VIVSTTLAQRYVKDDMFVDWWALTEADGTSDINAGFLRLVNDYTASSGSLAFVGVLTGGPSTGATEISLHRFNPVTMQEHFNRARQDLFPDLSTGRALATLVTGQRQFTYTLPSTSRGGPIQVMLGQRDSADDVAENQFTDGGMEIWTNSTTLTNWTLSGTGATVNQETETTTPTNYGVLHDTYSARVLSASSGVTSLLETVTPSVATEAMEVNVSVWVYCMTSDRVSVRIAGSDGSTHGGTGWELLTHTANTAATATTIAAGIACTAGTVIVFYVDEAIQVIGQSEPLDRNWKILLNWVWVPPVAGASNGGTLEFTYPLPPKRRLRIMSRGMLSALTSDTATTELDGEQLDVIYNKTREYLIRDELNTMPVQDRMYWHREADRYAAAVERDVNKGKGTPSVKARLKVPDYAY